MKNNKLTKSIKIISLISGICLFVVCLFILTLKFINQSLIPDKIKNVLYAICKYSVLSFLIIAASSVVLLTIKIQNQFDKTTNCFYDLFRIILVGALIITATALLFTYTKKYVVKIETWYGHISFYTGLLVLISCLMLNFYHLNKNNFYQKISCFKKDDDLVLFKIKFYYFKFEIIWLTFSSILGLCSMVFNKYVSQISSMINMLILIEMCFNVSFIFYLNKKSKNYKSYICLCLLIFTCVITCFNVTSYYFMYPIDEISSININYFIAAWNYILSILLSPCFILSARKLTTNQNTTDKVLL